jgi:hypothetical protein
LTQSNPKKERFIRFQVLVKGTKYSIRCRYQRERFIRFQVLVRNEIRGEYRTCNQPKTTLSTYCLETIGTVVVEMLWPKKIGTK